MHNPLAVLAGATFVPLTGAELCTALALAAHLDGPGILRATMAAGGLDETAAREFLQDHGHEVAAEATRLELSGAAVAPAAHAFNLKFVTRALAEADSMELMDMADVVKHTLRIVETDERARLAERSNDANLPMVNITINNGRRIRIEAAPRAADDAIDVEARDMDMGDLL